VNNKLLKRLTRLNRKRTQLYTLKDIKLPSTTLSNYRYGFPEQAHNENDLHYHFKCALGFYLSRYFYYNNNYFFNPNKETDPFLKDLVATPPIIFEYQHLGIPVTKKNEDEHTKRMRDGKYVYTSDIFQYIQTESEQRHVFIEINGGIHTKNPEQKQNNRMRYNAIRESYHRRGTTKMSMIIFESDEVLHQPMDYFINTIIRTIMNKKEKEPDPFLFEI
jgi:hypothetical protein